MRLGAFGTREGSVRPTQCTRAISHRERAPIKDRFGVNLRPSGSLEQASCSGLLLLPERTLWLRRAPGRLATSMAGSSTTPLTPKRPIAPAIHRGNSHGDLRAGLHVAVFTRC